MLQAPSACGSSLRCGAVAPDLPYFLRATGIPVSAQSRYAPFLNATTSHSPLGALTVTLPLAALLYLGVLAAARPVATLVPDDAEPADGARTRRPPAVRTGWVLVSLLLGIATHLAWDSLTHGWVAANAPGLQQTLTGSLTVARALQHLSTALGLLVIGFVLWRRRAALLPAAGTPARARLLRTLGVGVVAGLAGAASLTARRPGPPPTLEHALSTAAVGAGLAVGATAAVALAAWWLLRLRGRQVSSRRR